MICGIIFFWSIQASGEEWTEAQKEVWKSVEAFWENSKKVIWKQSWLAFMTTM
jgi:hypothetical protein